MSERQTGTFYYVLDEPMELLFVDDDPILREFALVQLATDMATVRLAEDGCAALNMIRGHPPSLVILDIEMPQMDGFQVLAALRADPATADLPVIVCTGREDVLAIDRAFQAGASSFVVKPINWRLLTHQIRYVFRSQRSDRLAHSAMRELAAASEPLLLAAAKGAADLRPQAAAFAQTLERLTRRPQTPTAIQAQGG